MAAADATQKDLKVVAHMKAGGLIKGYLRPEDPAFDPMVAGVIGGGLPSKIALYRPEGDSQLLDLDKVKAVYFVKTFEGRTDYTELKFFERNPQVEGLWIRIRFRDHECTEGVVHNSLPFVTDPGFFLRPPDPQSNNRVVYVVKSSLVEFRVLGMRSEY
jgi:hypothetical protein